MSSDGAITRLLDGLRDGAPGAQEALYTALYDRLHRLASAQLSRESRSLTLTPTALVHEVFLAVSGHEHAWTDRAHALAVASRAMRHILVDHARRRSSQKRGSGAPHTSLRDLQSRLATPGSVFGLDEHSHALLDLDLALTRLGERDTRLVEVVECRVFGGLTKAETAAALGISTATVDRDWARARAYLHTELAA